MKSKVFILSLLFALLFLVVAEKGEAVCVTPIENLNVNESMTLCSGSYSINDTVGDGAILINASNIVLDGNGSTIYGNLTLNSRGIHTNQKTNISIININISRYYRGINLDRSHNSSFNNITITNFSSSGVYYFRAGDTIFENSTVSNLNWSSLTNGTYAVRYNGAGYGFYLDSSAGLGVYKSKIKYNNISYVQGAVYMANSSQITISDNVISFIGYNGYAIDFNRAPGVNNFTSNTDVFNNYIYVGGWDVMRIIGSNNRIYNNTMLHSFHHGPDTLWDDTTLNSTYGGNNTFYDNYYNDFLYADPDYDNVQPYCFFIAQQVSNTFYNNICLNSTIQLGDVDDSRGHLFYNNTVKTGTEYNCFAIRFGTNMTIRDNIVHNYCPNTPGTSGMFFLQKPVMFNGTNTTATLYNNTLVDINNYALLYVSATNNMTLNYTGNTATIPLVVDYGGSQKVNYTYAGLKQLTFVNYIGTITANLINQALAYPFNDVYNVSSSSILQSNIDNYSITLTSGQQIIVGNYSFIAVNITYPSGTLDYYVTGVRVNITDPDSVYQNSSILLYNSAFVVLQNYTNSSLNFVTNYTILNGGTYYSRVLVFTNTSTLVDSGYLQFMIVNATGKILHTPPIDPNTLAQCRSTVGAMIVSFSEIPSWLTIMMAVLAASIIIGILLYAQGEFNMSFESGAFMIPVVAVLLSGFIFVIGIIILSAVC